MDNIVLTTIGGHEVIFKSYLTGREANKVKQVLFAKMNYSAVPGEEAKPISFTGELILQQELANIEATVTSVDGKTENILDLVQDLANSDYQQVVEKANELTKDLFPKPPVVNL